MRKFFVGVLTGLVLVPCLVEAEPSNFLVKNDPETLFAGIAVEDECPFSLEEVDHLVKGIMIRSRIEPAASWKPNEPILDVDLQCVKQDDWVKRVVSLNVQFIKVDVDDEGEALITHTTKAYSALGIGDKPYITQNLQHLTQKAIADYLKVNHDLTDN